MENTDNWQREVYQFAADLMERQGLKTVYDIGCGSGYKLLNYLGKYETTGFDLEPTVNALRQKYPDRSWKVSDFSFTNIEPADLVICADVIEHVKDPDKLLDFLERISKCNIIISTPDRNFLYRTGSRYRLGPPTNPSHIREWTSDELYLYISERFRVLHHQITNAEQGTQMIVFSRLDLS
jgi:SAM-dependent methyltransferase